MSVPEPRRAAQAVAIASIGLPCALIAHLLVTGAPAGTGAAVLAAGAVLLVAGAVPARSASALAVLTGLSQVAAHAILAVVPAQGTAGSPACLPAVGRAASLGLRLALLRADGTCPSGTLAIGPTFSALCTAGLLAVAILAGHAAVALLGGVFLARATDAVQRARHLATGVLAVLAGVVRRILADLLPGLLRPVDGAPAPAPDGARRPRTARWRPVPAARRGPPAFSALAP